MIRARFDTVAGRWWFEIAAWEVDLEGDEVTVNYESDAEFATEHDAIEAGCAALDYALAVKLAFGEAAATGARRGEIKVGGSA